MTAFGSRLSALGLLLLAATADAQQNRGRGGIRVMTLMSPAFAGGGMIPAKHAQPGRDVSPALSWSGAPDSVASYVLIMHDADAAIGDGLDDVLHWMVWNIPGRMTSLPEGIKQSPTVRIDSVNIRQLSVSGPYYRGPAAPSTGPPHHYVFELYALDANVNIQAGVAATAVTRSAVLKAIEGHVRGKGVLVGLYRRSDPPQP